MGRGRQPWKYKNDEERAQARRAHVRENVKRLRERRKAQEEEQRLAEAAQRIASGQSSGRPEKEKKEYKFVVATPAVKKKTRVRVAKEDVVLEEEGVEELTIGDRWDAVSKGGRLILPSKPGTYDMVRHSKHAPIDLEFKCLEALMNHFQKVATDKLPWARALSESRNIDRLLEIAMSSAGTQYIGRMNRDRKLLDFSRGAYDETVSLLNTRIMDTGISQAPNLVLVTTALFLVSMLETFLEGRRDHKEWVDHYTGFVTLMKTAGPSVFQSTMGMVVLRGMRHGILFVNIIHEEPSFLDSLGWRRLPLLEDIVTPRSPFNQAQDAFWDLAAKMTTKVHQANCLLARLCQNPSSPVRRGDAVVLATELRFLREEFKGWFFHVDTNIGKRLSWVVRPTPTSNPVDLIFLTGQAFEFQDLPSAELITAYWIYAFHLWNLCVRYQGGLARLEQPLYLSVEVGLHIAELEMFAQSICQCLWWYMSRPIPTSSLLLSLSYPLRVATRFFATAPQQYHRELDWCLSSSDKVRKSGMPGGLAEFFVDPFLPMPVFQANA